MRSRVIEVMGGGKAVDGLPQQRRLIQHRLRFVRVSLDLVGHLRQRLHQRGLQQVGEIEPRPAPAQAFGKAAGMADGQHDVQSEALLQISCREAQEGILEHRPSGSQPPPKPRAQVLSDPADVARLADAGQVAGHAGQGSPAELDGLQPRGKLSDAVLGKVFVPMVGGQCRVAQRRLVVQRLVDDVEVFRCTDDLAHQRAHRVMRAGHDHRSAEQLVLCGHLGVLARSAGIERSPSRTETSGVLPRDVACAAAPSAPDRRRGAKVRMHVSPVFPSRCSPHAAESAPARTGRVLPACCGSRSATSARVP